MIKVRPFLLATGLCLVLPVVVQAQASPSGAKADAKAALKALKAANATSPSQASDETAVQAAGESINAQSVSLGVDPLSLITVVPGGPPTRLPIAIPNAIKIGDNVDPTALGQTFIEIVRNDLTMSGLFEILPVETYALVDATKEGITESTIQFDSWYNVGASALVKTHYSVEHDKGQFSFAVYDVDSATELSLRYGTKAINPKNVREIAHDFANSIIGFYTGTKGVFGTRILFAAHDRSNYRKIQAFDTDGFGTHNYDVPEAINVMPEWGPGSSIYFTQLSTKGDNIYQYDGENLIQRTDFSGWASGADYCAKSGKVAFTGAGEENANIFVMNADGSELVQVTDLANNIQASPSWSPDCKRIAFVSDYSGRPQIYTINADGSGMRRLTWVGNYNTTPDWSPKGDLIVFTARDERNVFDIFSIDVNTGEVMRLTQDQGHNKEPSWAPDGRYIVFESTRDGKQARLYLMNADGRWQTRISARPGLRTPVWHR